MLNSQRSLTFREVWAPTGTLYKIKLCPACYVKQAGSSVSPDFPPMMSYVEWNSLQEISPTNDGVVILQPIHVQSTFTS